ncbi:MAG: hypothetical protein AB7G75_35235 [Candidatus Binatia bacterium]
MKMTEIQERLSPEMQELGTKLLGLANASWETLKNYTAVSQELVKDPFTEPVKHQAATAELLLFLLHICDRIASAAFTATVAEDSAAVLRQSFMTGLIGATVPSFVQAACPDEEDQEETQADLLHLYNTRAIQYGLFPFGASKSPEGQEPVFLVTGIRLAEALECPDNLDILLYSTEVIVSLLAQLRTQLPLRETIGKLIAGTKK